VFDFSLATRLLLRGGSVAGVEALDLQSGERVEYYAETTVIATGGAGRMFAYTTNPEVATGDGVGLAFDAGAEVSDLEFYQFHPTALRVEGAPPFLISEAVRGEGAVLRNASGEAFMPRYHPDADLAPRDVVARAIVAEMRAGGHVTLDCTSIGGVDLAARFPGIFSYCIRLGVDMRTEPIPVAPAAHYMMGGIRTDIWGRTTLPGLYACGECACTGVHGANRLASNSLMETVVFGKRVVEHMVSGEGGAAPTSEDRIALAATGGGTLGREAIQSLMWDACGIERSGDALAAALAAIETGNGVGPPGVDGAESRRAVEERRGMTELARLMMTAALRREESRGGHYRSDFPEPDDARWRRHQVFCRGD
jgi:L-aspartate oxidase